MLHESRVEVVSVEFEIKFTSYYKIQKFKI